MTLRDGWYLMTTAELEQELRRWREPAAVASPTGAPRLSVADALARRNAGNLPDASGRTLRLVLHVDGTPGSVERARGRFEPDFHDEPTWRRPGSVPINVVPLRERSRSAGGPRAWFEDPELAALEAEWAESGTVDAVRVPPELRGFVFKTVLALRSAHKEVSPQSIAASIARWVPPEDASRIRAALMRANSAGTKDASSG